MNILGASDKVQIRVCNDTNSDLRILLYQSDIHINALTYLAGAWRNAMLSSGSALSAVMPIDMLVGAAEEGEGLTVSTKLLPASQGHSFNIFTNDNEALCIEEISKKQENGVIAVENQCECSKWVKVFKDGSPILAAELRPDFTESISIKPKLGLALGENGVTTAFFDATQLSRKVEADLRNQSFVTFRLAEDMGTRKIIIEISYDKF